MRYTWMNMKWTLFWIRSHSQDNRAWIMNRQVIQYAPQISKSQHFWAQASNKSVFTPPRSPSPLVRPVFCFCKFVVFLYIKEIGITLFSKNTTKVIKVFFLGLQESNHLEPQWKNKKKIFFFSFVYRYLVQGPKLMLLQSPTWL